MNYGCIGVHFFNYKVKFVLLGKSLRVDSRDRRTITIYTYNLYETLCTRDRPQLSGFSKYYPTLEINPVS